MLRKLRIQEKATVKAIDLEPCSLGVLLVLCNHALKEKIHIELDLDDMRSVVALLQNRIEEVELEMKGYEYGWTSKNEHSKGHALEE